MATIPIVNAFDRRAGIITSVIAMLGLLIAILLMRYEQADPPPKDIPMMLAEPIDVTIIEHVVIEDGGGGAGNPSEDPKNDPHQTEEIITKDNSDTEVAAGSGNETNSDNDNPPSGDESEDHFNGGSNDGNDGGHNGISGTDSGTGTSGTGSGSSGGARKVIAEVYSLPDYDHVVKFRFKVTIDASGNVISVINIKGTTTTTDQVLINKVRQAVIKQVKYSKAPGAPAVTKIYNFSLQPK